MPAWSMVTCRSSTAAWQPGYVFEWKPDMRVLLIRHCKTKFNVSGHIMGWSDSPHVEDWLEDVQFIEHELAQRHLLPDLVFTSALGRARHTGD